MARQKRRTKTVPLTLPVTALGIDSNYEPVTRAVFDYREVNVYPYLAAKGLQVSRLQGPLARRIYAAPEAKKPEVEYLTGVGHGEADVFAGDHGDRVFHVGSYHPEEAKGKIVHFLACKTARELGPDFVANGCRAYFGYDEDFAFPMAEKEMFLGCDSEIDRAFADGLTAAEAYDRAKRLFEVRIADLRAQGKVREAAILVFDLNHLRCPSSGGDQRGDAGAKLG